MSDVSDDPRGIGDATHFWIRRLHSLTGIIPVGVFLCFHLIINGTVVLSKSGETFQNAVIAIHALDRLGVLRIVEVLGIFIPLAFHAVIGVQIWLSGKQNVATYRYGGNIRYTLQRWTAIIVLLFILYHVWQMHWLGAVFGGGKFDPHHAPYTAAETLQAAWWIAPIYVIGILAAVFHFCNGIWTFLIVWGIAIGRNAQARLGYVCAGVGIVLTVVGLAALTVLRTCPLADYAAPPDQAEHLAVTYEADAGLH